MKSTFKVLFYLKRDKQKANGTIPLFCRITVDGEEARFGMKCDVNPQFWDVKAGIATGRTAEASKINALINNTKAAIYKIYREQQERDNYVTADKIKNVFLGIEQKQQTILELFDNHNNERKLQIGICFSKSSHDKYRITRKCLSEFIVHKYNQQDIPVKEINKQFISDFESFLFVQYEYSRNNVTTLLKKFRHILEVAINNEWISKNPFRDYKFHWEKTDRGYLAQVEIEKLINSQFENERMEIARDIFIFCCFTGLAYTDIKHLTTENIQSSFDGKLWIRGKRKKTNITYDIPLMNISKAILDKYKQEMQNNLLLPVFTIGTYNRLLKKMAIHCEINKNFSSHLARHTFATLTLTKGVSIESVSKMLGHTNITTTQIYARRTDKKVVNEMTVFENNVKKMDIKLQFTKEQTNVIDIDILLQLYKISKGKASNIIWETLTTKVWNKMSNSDKQSFATECKLNETKQKTMCEFYQALMDFFLENLNEQNEKSTFQEEYNKNEETDFAINF